MVEIALNVAVPVVIVTVKLAGTKNTSGPFRLPMVIVEPPVPLIVNAAPIEVLYTYPGPVAVLVPDPVNERLVAEPIVL